MVYSLLLPWNKEKDREEYWCKLCHLVSEGEYPDSESYTIWMKVLIKKDVDGYRYYESNSNDQYYFIDHVFAHFLCAESIADQRMEQFEAEVQSLLENINNEKGYAYMYMSDLEFLDNKMTMSFTKKIRKED